MKNIELTTARYELKEGTKTVWVETSKEIATINEERYKSILDWSPMMRRLGGSESLKRTYTSAGYKVYEIVSKSPDRQSKTIRNFKFN